MEYAPNTYPAKPDMLSVTCSPGSHLIWRKEWSQHSVMNSAGIPVAQLKLPENLNW